jgi:hypothetical protein
MTAMKVKTKSLLYNCSLYNKIFEILSISEEGPPYLYLISVPNTSKYKGVGFFLENEEAVYKFLDTCIFNYKKTPVQKFISKRVAFIEKNKSKIICNDCENHSC